MTTECAQAWYVYSVLTGDAGAPPGDGVLPGAPVEAIHVEQITVLASLVPRGLFDSSSTANRTADPAWIAARIEAHHAVNVAATEAGACLPLAFGALFSSLDRLQQWLAPRAARLGTALALVTGRAEWSLSVQEDEAAHTAWLDREDAGLKSLSQAMAAAGEGTAFLLARRLEKARNGARLSHIAATAANISTRLLDARFDVLDEPPKGGLPGWALLASKSTPEAASTSDDRFLAELVQLLAADLQPTGLSLRLTGPWPAYAFARAALAQEVING